MQYSIQVLISSFFLFFLSFLLLHLPPKLDLTWPAKGCIAYRCWFLLLFSLFLLLFCYKHLPPELDLTWPAKAVQYVVVDFFFFFFVSFFFSNKDLPFKSDLTRHQNEKYSMWKCPSSLYCFWSNCMQKSLVLYPLTLRWFPRWCSTSIVNGVCYLKWVWVNIQMKSIHTQVCIFHSLLLSSHMQNLFVLHLLSPAVALLLFFTQSVDQAGFI